MTTAIRHATPDGTRCAAPHDCQTRTGGEQLLALGRLPTFRRHRYLPAFESELRFRAPLGSWRDIRSMVI